MTAGRRQDRLFNHPGWTLAAILALSLGSASCAERDHNPQSDPTAESTLPSLLTLERGAVITSRTGELRLDASAMLAIDDDPLSAWVTPPNDPAQTMVIALPVSSRIEQIGVSIARGEAPRAVLFERSIDGQTFVPLASIDVEDPSRPAFLDVAPSEASAIRVTIQEESDKQVSLAMISASGHELSAYQRPVLTGSWTISGQDAGFAQMGTRIIGTLATDPPTNIDGFWADRTIQFLYVRGNEYGLGAIVVSPDGRYLNGMPWYHVITPLHVAPVWFGEKAGNHPEPVEARVRERWLEREKSVPLFGIMFGEDGRVMEDESDEPLRWLADHLTQQTEGTFAIVKRVLEREANHPEHATTRAQLDSLRSVLAARGVDVARVGFDVIGIEGLEHVPRKRLEREMLTSVILRSGETKEGPW